MFPILESMKHFSMNPIHLRALDNKIVTPLLDELDIREKIIMKLADMVKFEAELDGPVAPDSWASSLERIIQQAMKEIEEDHNERGN